MSGRLESSIERVCTKYATDKDAIAIKLLALIGLPDKLFLFYGRVMFVEFKRPGETPRKIQLFWHALLRKHFFDVYVIDNVERFKEIINEFTKHAH